MRHADGNCSDFDRRLQANLDRRIDLDDDVLAEHAATCEPCRELLESYASLLDAVRSCERPEPACGLADRVCVGLGARRRRGESRWKGIALSAVAVAAGVIAAIVPWFRSAPPSVASRADHAGAAHSSVAEPYVPVVGRSRAPMVSKTASSGATESGPDAVRDLFETFAEQLSADALPPLRQVNEITAVGLRPIAASFGSAFSALRNSLPVLRDDERPKPQASVPSMRLIA
ncbi:MAG: hypothetical protein FJ297_03015 [Planctomycetes bacterium]|nr:hypothetical protein [Planctomycetota bacterium]